MSAVNSYNIPQRDLSYPGFRERSILVTFIIASIALKLVLQKLYREAFWVLDVAHIPDIAELAWLSNAQPGHISILRELLVSEVDIR